MRAIRQLHEMPRAAYRSWCFTWEIVEDKSLGFTHYDGHAYPILFVSKYSRVKLLHIEDHAHSFRLFHFAQLDKSGGMFLEDLQMPREDLREMNAFLFPSFANWASSTQACLSLGEGDMFAFTLMATEVLQSIQAEAHLAERCMEWWKNGMVLIIPI